MRKFLIVLIVLVSSKAIAQDDYPDYRSKRELFSRIVEKDIRSDIASFSMGGIDESVGKLPLKTIPSTGYGPDFISFTGDNIQVKITTMPFDATKHKLGYYDNKYLVKMFRLEGKVAAITGGGSGIGRACKRAIEIHVFYFG